MLMLLFFPLHRVTLGRYLLPWNGKAAHGRLNGLSMLLSHNALLFNSLEVPNYFTQQDLKSYSKQLASKELAIFLVFNVGERNPTSYFSLLLYKNKNNHIKMLKINFKCATVGERHLLSGRTQRNLNRLICVLCVKCRGHNSK